MVERPLADAYAPLRAPILRSAVIFVLGLGLSILASILLARRMVAPIRVLQEGAARIGAGDLGHRIEVRTGDELEALGDELNRTAGQLEESYANLEEKVEARTRELADANAGLTETLEQQTATGEILRVISSSPTDAQPVFDTIARSARRLCDAEFCQVFRLDAELLHFVAHDGQTAEAHAVAKAAFPRPADRGSAAGRAVLDGAVAEISDVHADPAYTLGTVARAITFRSIVAVPMLRDGQPVGAIAVARSEAGRFPERQIELLKTFADQAVIAVENVRLFTGAGGPDPRPDPLGRRAPGAGGGQPGRQLHPRSRDRARDHRQPGRRALRQLQRDRLRVRRGHADVPARGPPTASPRTTSTSCAPHRSASGRAPSGAPA